MSGPYGNDFSAVAAMDQNEQARLAQQQQMAMAVLNNALMNLGRTRRDDREFGYRKEQDKLERDRRIKLDEATAEDRKALQNYRNEQSAINRRYAAIAEEQALRDWEQGTPAQQKADATAAMKSAASGLFNPNNYKNLTPEQLAEVSATNAMVRNEVTKEYEQHSALALALNQKKALEQKIAWALQPESNTKKKSRWYDPIFGNGKELNADQLNAADVKTWQAELKGLNEQVAGLEADKTLMKNLRRNPKTGFYEVAYDLPWKNEKPSKANQRQMPVPVDAGVAQALNLTGGVPAEPAPVQMDRRLRSPGMEPQATQAQPQIPEIKLPSGKTVDALFAQRVNELVSQGMSPVEAVRRVRMERKASALP